MLKKTDSAAPEKIPRDYRHGQLKPGDYVLVLNPPSYPGVETGSLGRIVGGRWLYKDGTLNVDVVGSLWNEEHRISDDVCVGRMDVHGVNLALYPFDLRRLSEKILKDRMLPKRFRIAVNGVAYDLYASTLYSQYQTLSSCRKPDDFQPFGE